MTLGLAWPDGLSPPNGRLDVFGHWRLAPDGWTRLAQIDVSGAQSPASVEIGIDRFPTDAMARTAFFRLATQADADGDGVSDACEAWTQGTDPKMRAGNFGQLRGQVPAVKTAGDDFAIIRPQQRRNGKINMKIAIVGVAEAHPQILVGRPS